MSPDVDIKVQKKEQAEELSGQLDSQTDEDKLMHSVIENDQETIDEGKVIKDAINQGLGSFTPDMMFENLVKDYRNAEQIYGKSMLRYLTGYDPDYVKKNIKIPEFQKEIKKNIGEGIKKLKDKELINKDLEITKKGFYLASLILYTEELDHIVPKGILGEYEHKKTSHYGLPKDTKLFKKGDRYHDIAVKKSIKVAIRRGHNKLMIEDLRAFERQSKGKAMIIYAMDASGSMKGKRIEASKKAGIALAFKAINKKDKIGLIVFKNKVISMVEPTQDFSLLLKEITPIRASGETDFSSTVSKAIEMFPTEKITKHLILLSDALPTYGADPEHETLAAIALAKENGITISLIGINLDKKGEELGRKMIEIGEGKFWTVKNVDELDKIVLEDYYGVM